MHNEIHTVRKACESLLGQVFQVVAKRQSTLEPCIATDKPSSCFMEMATWVIIYHSYSGSLVQLPQAVSFIVVAHELGHNYGSSVSYSLYSNTMQDPI